MKIMVNAQEHTLRRWRFAGGEIGVRFDDPAAIFQDCSADTVAEIFTHLHSSDDLMALFLASDALRRLWRNHVADRDLPITVTIPYLPYARQDRVCAPGESFSLALLATLINAQNYAAVRVWDVHSPVADRLIARFHTLSALKISDACRTLLAAEHVLVAPDAGATPRVAAIAQTTGRPMIAAQKRRDPGTGAIMETSLVLDEIQLNAIAACDCLIVDDICDGGRTFIELAHKLRPFTRGKISLYITHGIFSQGLAVFDGAIDRVYCPNVWPGIDDHPLLVRL